MTISETVLILAGGTAVLAILSSIEFLRSTGILTAWYAKQFF